MVCDKYHKIFVAEMAYMKQRRKIICFVTNANKQHQADVQPSEYAVKMK